MKGRHLAISALGSIGEMAHRVLRSGSPTPVGRSATDPTAVFVESEAVRATVVCHAGMPAMRTTVRAEASSVSTKFTGSEPVTVPTIRDVSTKAVRGTA